jgi:hypothetical protein
VNQQQPIPLRKFKAERSLPLKLDQQALGPKRDLLRRVRQPNLDKFPLLVRDIDRIGKELHEQRTGVRRSSALCQHRHADSIDTVPKVPHQT